MSDSLALSSILSLSFLSVFHFFRSLPFFLLPPSVMAYRVRAEWGDSHTHTHTDLFILSHTHTHTHTNSITPSHTHPQIAIRHSRQTRVMSGVMVGFGGGHRQVLLLLPCDIFLMPFLSTDMLCSSPLLSSSPRLPFPSSPLLSSSKS